MNRQNIKGNDNQIAGRDINNFNQLAVNMTFSDTDLKLVINELSKIEFTSISENSETDLKRTSMEDKNKINNLSDEYFDRLLEDYFPYFDRIEDFLKDSLNIDCQRKYNDIVKDINFCIRTQKKTFNYCFEYYFSVLYGKIFDEKFFSSNNLKEISKILIHYMYWHCDIGENVK